MPVLCTFNLWTKFEMSNDMVWAPKCRNGSGDPDYTHLGPTRVQNLKSLAVAIAECDVIWPVNHRGVQGRGASRMQPITAERQRVRRSAKQWKCMQSWLWLLWVDDEEDSRMTCIMMMMTILWEWDNHIVILMMHYVADVYTVHKCIYVNHVVLSISLPSRCNPEEQEIKQTIMIGH